MFACSPGKLLCSPKTFQHFLRYPGILFELCIVWVSHALSQASASPESPVVRRGRPRKSGEVDEAEAVSAAKKRKR